jgi:hypothetical protein
MVTTPWVRLWACGINPLTGRRNSGRRLSLQTSDSGAAAELSELVGVSFKANSDDYVDFYEAYYPAEESWTAGEESRSAYASDAVLSRIAG